MGPHGSARNSKRAHRASTHECGRGAAARNPHGRGDDRADRLTSWHEPCITMAPRGNTPRAKRRRPYDSARSARHVHCPPHRVPNAPRARGTTCGADRAAHNEQSTGPAVAACGACHTRDTAARRVACNTCTHVQSNPLCRVPNAGATSDRMPLATHSGADRPATAVHAHAIALATRQACAPCIPHDTGTAPTARHTFCPHTPGHAPYHLAAPDGSAWQRPQLQARAPRLHT